MKTYTVVCLGSALVAALITPVVIYIARMLKAVDVPGIRRVHLRPVPRIGGVPIFVSMMCLTVPVLFLHNIIGDRFRDILPSVIVLLSGATFMFVVGLIDDIRGLTARVKFAAQLVAAITVCAADIRINSISVGDWFTINFGWFSWPLTILWIVGIVNAVNLCDGLDGLAAGISVVACGVIAILAIRGGNSVMAVLMLALLGSLLGFLFFNFNPARIFMGDGGSQFIGFTIASASVMNMTKSHALIGLALPVLALGIPIFDTLFSMLRRFLERRSIFSSDRNHFHHRLLDLGLSQRHAAIVAYAVTLAATVLGLFMIATRDFQTVVIFFCILLLIVLVFRVVGSVRLRETIVGLQNKYAVTRQMKEEIENFERIELHFRRTASFDDWWHAVCTAGHEMDFMRISLSVKNDNGANRTLTWEHPHAHKVDSEAIVNLTIPLSHTADTSRLSLAVDINVNGSLESAGRRAALFSRLIDGQSVVNLPNKMKNSSAFEEF